MLLKMSLRTDLLIVGAGPFGLAMAAQAQDDSIDHLIVGRPMDLWRSNMPKDMILRSHCDWHLDPAEEDTLERYVQTRGLTSEAVEPLSRDFYLDYVDWFQSRKGIEPLADLVARLDSHADGFQATLESGGIIAAKRVLVAIGFRYFQYVPAELAALLPAGRYAHTCELVSFEPLRGQRCLIIGGRQSAFEWAALLTEAGADTVHVSHRHETPQFTDSEWGWINEMTARFVTEPGWYRALSGAQQADVQSKFAEAKIKLEPWLWPRIDHDNVHLWPSTRLESCTKETAGDLQVGLDSGQSFTVDYVILATGYRVDMKKVPFLVAGNVFDRLAVEEGYPVLDDSFESSVEGLFITSLPASRHFGPFFAFTVAVRASAQIVAKALG